MKFTISSSELFTVLQYVGKVINSKHTLPILDYFLFDLKENRLTITASDLETTQVSTIDVSSSIADGMVTVPSRLIIDFLKEFADQPITIDVNPDTSEILVSWETGQVSIPGLPADGYPNVTEKNGDTLVQFTLGIDELYDGITNTIFAAADKNIRPIMNGVCIDIRSEKLVFVATDAHKLVKMTFPKSVGIEQQTMIVIPKKAAAIIKAFCTKESGDVVIDIDSKNIYFTMNDTTIISRSIEGNFPNYDVVIPQNNKNKMIIDRVSLLNSIKRVAVCSNQVTNLILLKLEDNMLYLEAKDPEFSVSANDSLKCLYDGDKMVIGFKSSLLIDILSTISTQEVSIELSEPTQAGLIVPVQGEEDASYELIMLLMPIMP